MAVTLTTNRPILDMPLIRRWFTWKRPKNRAVAVQQTGSAAATNATSGGYISIRGVSKTFMGRSAIVEAIGAIDLDVADGEFVSVIGPSGCGKSTLLMLLSGLDRATTGTIRVGGKIIDSPTSDLGIVFQQDVLLEWRTALENILLQAEIRGSDRNAAMGRATDLLAMVSLEGFAAAYPYELSGGMRQRVAICRALLHEPPLLLMDEPFGALDALTRDQLQIDLLRLWSKQKMTVVFVTHSIPEAVFLSDRIVVLSPRPGRIEEIIKIDLPRPRRLSMRETPEFLRYNQQVTSVFKALGVLRDEV
jgi:NitT/TauT family transport system ATP-binding protein